MSFQEWLEQESKVAEYKVTPKKVAPNSFIYRAWSIDARRGLVVDVCVDKSGDISVIDTNVFRFSDFTKAEGWSQSFMFESLRHLIRGDYVVHSSGILRRKFIVFEDKDSNSKVYGKHPLLLRK